VTGKVSVPLVPEVLFQKVEEENQDGMSKSRFRWKQEQPFCYH